MSHTDAFQAAFREGTRLLKARRPNDALPHLERACRLAPDHNTASLNLAGAYILAGRFSKAVPILEDLSDREPDNPMVWINLGAAYLGNPILATDEQQFEAINAFKRALELNPKAPSVHYNIGLIHRDRGEFDEAAAMFRRAIQVNPGDADALSLLNKLTQAPD